MLASLWCLIFTCPKPTTEDVFYRVFKGSVDHYIDIPSGNPAELYNHINPWEPTSFYIHGWKEGCHNVSALEVSSAVLSLGGINVCCLDWSAVSKENYMIAAPGALEIASIFSKDISEMSDMGFEPQTMNVCGFSLGAHMAGAVGKHLQDTDYPNLGQITALDPAKPLFDPPMCPGCRPLEATDADMVFTIHTSGGTYGISTPNGKCDIYPNYGTLIQKGCPSVPTTFDLTQIIPTYRCSHDRSWRLYGDAIRNPNTQMALRCDSSESFAANSCSENTMISIGMFMPKNISGTYYYMTNGESPYGDGARGMRPYSP